MYQLTKQKKPLFIKIVIFLVGCAVAKEVLNLFFKQPTIEQSLVTMCNEVNKHCPIQVDSVTRLENMAALVGKHVLYNYSVVTNKVEVDTFGFKKEMTAIVATQIKTNPKLKVLRDEGVLFSAMFYNEQHQYITSIDIGANDYK